MKKMSDSESDEDIDNLRAAIDPQFSFNSCENGSVTQITTDKPTRRERLQSEYGKNNNGSPEFSDFIARKLSEILDRRIKVVNIADNNLEEGEIKDKGGIKLFASSEAVLHNDEHVSLPKTKQKRPDLLKSARKAKSARTGGEDEEGLDEKSKLASVAVSADWILSGSH